MLLDKTDSYKVSHWLQFPEDMEYSHYYIESRSKNKRLKFFGLQMILKKYFTEVPTRAEVNEIGNMWESHGLPFNWDGWNYLADLGYYPLSIVAKKEGSIVDSGEALVTVTTTDPKVPWLAGWAETILMQLWYPITVATKSWECKEVIQHYLDKTGYDAVDFKLHDFGFRGVSSLESAAIGGLAHLTNFMGTDTFPAIIAAKEFYNANVMPAFSIPASEHSTITSWGKDREAEAYKNMLDKFGHGIVACVSDSYDLTNAVTKLWGKELYDDVMRCGTLVIRPDSGDPVAVVLRTLREMHEAFGSTINAKGYKVLTRNVRLIQGDGIGGPEDIRVILQAMYENGFSADNIAFGMGGGLLQAVGRDDYKFAMKMSAYSDGKVWYDVYKEPKDAPWKKSKRGVQSVEGGVLYLLNGKMKVDYTLEEVRANE